MSGLRDAEIDAKLVLLRRFLSTCPPELRAARLVQYRGVDLLERRDILLEDVEALVPGWMRKGFSVDWLYRNGLLYLRVCEPAAPAPSWQRLFAELDIDEMKSMLRGDGFGNEP